MNSSTTSFTSSILIVLYILTGTLPNFDAIDILAPQWVYLCSINILVAVYLLYNKDSFASFFSFLSKSYFFLFYAFFIFWAALSINYAINKSETIINFPRYFNVFVAISFVTLLLSKIVGSHATSSFDPMTGNTSKSPDAPRWVIAQLRIASCKSFVPAVTG